MEMNHKGNCQESAWPRIESQIRPINLRTIRRRLKTIHPEPYRLGGSGGSGKNPDHRSGKSGDEPVNPFEAFFSSLSGGDMNALAAQLQSAFAMLGGAGSMFTSGPTDAGSGVNWEVTKDTARKTVASLGPDPSPNAAQQRAITEAVSLAEIWP